MQLITSPYSYTNDEKTLKYVQKKYPKSRFVMEVSIPLKSGKQTPNPAIVLYEESPKKAHPAFFAYYCFPTDAIAQAMGLPKGARWVIVGLPDFSPVVDGILTDEGVMISRTRDDLVKSPRGYFVTGGRESTQRSDETPIVRVNLLTRTYETESGHVGALTVDDPLERYRQNATD